MTSYLCFPWFPVATFYRCFGNYRCKTIIAIKYFEIATEKNAKKESLTTPLMTNSLSRAVISYQFWWTALFQCA